MCRAIPAWLALLALYGAITLVLQLIDLAEKFINRPRRKF